MIKDKLAAVTKAIHEYEGNCLMLTHFQAECLAKTALSVSHGEMLVVVDTDCHECAYLKMPALCLVHMLNPDEILNKSPKREIISKEKLRVQCPKCSGYGSTKPHHESDEWFNPPTCTLCCGRGAVTKNEWNYYHAQDDRRLVAPTGNSKSS